MLSVQAEIYWTDGVKKKKKIIEEGKDFLYYEGNDWQVDMFID